MYESLFTYIIILLCYSNNKILFINCNLIVNLKYVDSLKMLIFDSSNNYTFLNDLYRTIFFVSPKDQLKKSYMFLFKY